MSEYPAGPQPGQAPPPAPRRAAPRKPPSRAWFKTRQRLMGLVFLAFFVVLAGFSVAAFNKDFTGDTTVALYTDSTGNEMNQGADVSVRGVVVGQVRSITADGTGAKLDLQIDPGVAKALPSNVTAQMLPTTLFGERYVSLVVPAVPDARTLADTRTVSQDRSADAVELEKVLNDMLPMLTAVQPQKLSVTLTAIATALNGRGQTLGTTLDTVNSYLREFNPQLPALDKDITELVQVTQTYNQAAPGIIQSLRDFTVTSQTVASEAGNLSSLYDTVTGASGDLTSFLRQNKDNLISLSADSRDTLKSLAKYSPEFPCVFQQLTDFIPNMNKVLGAGTRNPGLHTTITVVPGSPPYKAGANTPKYGDDPGPHCYSTPFKGIALNDGGNTISTAGLGLPNSPQENELVTELTAPRVNVAPDKLPGWSSVLVGPLYRGTETKVG